MLITIYGRENCPFCTKAKELAESIETAETIYIDLARHGMTKADLQKTVGKPVETVPQIFVEGIHVGGFTEFQAKMKAENLIDD
tara:strand:- start:4925 stop:5176 length:252 start_codon:yes stop_codon:yes gene_type:complete